MPAARSAGGQGAGPDSPTAGSAAEFGRRVRERRRALGLSQAELVGDRLSPSYLSLLESGKRSPTPEVAQLLAGSLGCTADFLLRGHDPQVTERFHLEVRYAELALRNGEAADALARVDALLDGQSEAPAELVTAARRQRAHALEALGRLNEAITELETLDEQARGGGRLEEHLRHVVDLVRCYQEAGDVSHALDIGASTLRDVDGLGLTGSDVHAELVSTVIGTYYVRGDLVTAGRLAEAALRDVEDRGTPRARAAVLWNASLVAEARDDVAAAVLLADRALALYAEGDDARAINRLRVAYGWLLLRSQPPQADRAREVLLTARTSLADVGSATDLAYCETELSRAELLLGRPEAALEHAAAAREHLSDEAAIESAYVHLVRGAALLELGRRDESVAEYRLAARALGVLDVSRLAAGAWRELADAFTRLGLLEEAARAYQQALTELGIRAAPDVGSVGGSSRSTASKTSRTRQP